MAGVWAHARLAAMAALPCARLASGGGGNACSRAPKTTVAAVPSCARLAGGGGGIQRQRALATGLLCPSALATLKKWDDGGAPSGWGCEVAPAHLRATRPVRPRSCAGTAWWRLLARLRTVAVQTDDSSFVFKTEQTVAMLARLLSGGAAPARHSFSAVARELGAAVFFL